MFASAAAPFREMENTFYGHQEPLLDTAAPSPQVMAIIIIRAARDLKLFLRELYIVEEK